ncbi:MAG: hypothetical protein OQJ97_10160 [Rhodospirillales bacterium]|nr:hypothetical protein [Rhodospirillales bacterium]
MVRDTLNTHSQSTTEPHFLFQEMAYVSAVTTQDVWNWLGQV